MNLNRNVNEWMLNKMEMNGSEKALRERERETIEKKMFVTKTLSVPTTISHSQ